MFYSHAIGTRHNAGSDALNAIDFYLWDLGVDAPTATGTFRALTLDQTGSEFFTDLNIAGALTATSYGGIIEANLLDKSATESIAGAWTFASGASVTGNIDISDTIVVGTGNSETGDVLLKFNLDRAWQFEVDGEGSASALHLRSLAGSKRFRIKDSSNANTIAEFVASTVPIVALIDNTFIFDSTRLRISNELEVDGALNHDGSTVGFYGTVPTTLQTGVAVTAAGIHAALVTLGLITA